MARLELLQVGRNVLQISRQLCRVDARQRRLIDVCIQAQTVVASWINCRGCTCDAQRFLKFQQGVECLPQGNDDR